MYTIGNDGLTVDEYNLGTAWDVSTAEYSQEISVSDKELTPRGLFFKPDGSKMYTIGYDGDTVDEYNLGNPLLDKFSVIPDATFINTVDGEDTHPFTSGQKIRYTVQAGDAFSLGTYYWRVKGKDPAGMNIYGDWSSTRSFTVISGSSATISGIAYTDEGSTTLNSSGGAIKLVNNTTGATFSDSDGTDRTSYHPGRKT